jgi:hypothetical protein
MTHFTRLFGFILLSACPRDEGEGVKDGSLSDNARVSELDAQAQVMLCEEMENQARAGAKGVARFSCLVIESFKPTCSEDELDACTEQLVTELLAEDSECAQGLEPEVIASCDATVGEVRVCLADLDEVLEDLKQLDCGDLDTSPGDNPLAVESCEALEAKCPDLIQGQDEDSAP